MTAGQILNTQARTRRSVADRWVEAVNPCRGLTISWAQSIYDCARRHGSPTLQKIYDEIESCDPLVMTCVERRTAALSGLGWKALALSGKDRVLAEEQRSAILQLARNIDNFEEAVDHLDLAFFRGYSHLQPVWDGIEVRHVELLDSWNFLHSTDRREWYWNPECLSGIDGMEPVPESARLVSLVRRRAIDWPCVAIYLRQTVGERDWGRFLERYGLPPVDVVMAPNATNANRPEYVEAAESAQDARNTVWPAGSTVSRAENARGQDPFTAFIEHQQKLIVLMATGGTLTSLAQADTGSLAGGAQMDVWKQIVERDARLIGAAFDRNLFRPYLEAHFPGREIAAEFAIGGEDKPSASEALDLAVKARSAGFTFTAEELSELTGFKLERDAAAAMPPTAFARASDAKRTLAEMMYDQMVEEAAKELDGGDTAAASGTSEGARLSEELPDLLPDDPAMAAVLADEMAKAMADALN